MRKTWSWSPCTKTRPRAAWFSLKLMEEFRHLPPWIQEHPPKAFGAIYSADELVTQVRRLLA
jgi:hypothetical protein